VASYNVPAGHVGVYTKTLVADDVDTVTFQVGSTSTPGWGKMPKRVEVLSDGADVIYVTVNGSAPTVEGTHCYQLPAAAGSTILDVTDADPTDAVLVKLISAGTPTYSVCRA
jgi:hypothetical protein